MVVKSPSERQYLLLCERLRDNQDAVRVALYNAVGGPTDSLAAAAPRENPGAAAAAGSGAAPDDGPYAGARGAATSAAPGRRPPNFGAFKKGYWAAHADRPPPLQRPPPGFWRRGRWPGSVREPNESVASKASQRWLR